MNLNYKILNRIMKINVSILRITILCLLSIFIPITYCLSQATITLNAPESGTEVRTACDYISLQPNYAYTPTSGNVMYANINPNFCAGNYISAGSGFVGNGPPIINKLNTIAVGTTNGTFDVSSVGAATYDIPLIIPPGTMGMMPKLSLDYNSDGPNGLLGMGWSLSGLSSVTRLQQNLYDDNLIYPVTLTNKDRFNLDGNRLIITSGPITDYGTAYATYQTEVQTFQQVTSYGTASGGGPLFFLVQTKDGKTLEYGNTTDSRIYPKGSSSVVLTWLLDKVTDNTGNYMTIKYNNSNSTGQYYPIEIDYTGNTSQSPYNKVTFSYGTRSDEQSIYIAGFQENTNMLLTAITMFANGNLAHTYSLGYTVDALYSHLISVTESGTDGTPYNSTKFNWQNNLQQPILQQAVNIPGPSSKLYDPCTCLNGFGIAARGFLVGDMNGDGKTDVMEMSPTTADGTTNVSWYQSYSNYSADPKGIGNFVKFYNNSNVSSAPGCIGTNYFGTWGWYNGLNGGGSDVDATFNPMYGFSTQVPMFDINGDGKADLITYAELGGLDHFEVFLNHGGTFSSSPDYSFDDGISTNSGLPNPFVTAVGDFDGDGLQDLVIYYPEFGQMFMYSYNGGSVHQYKMHNWLFANDITSMVIGLAPVMYMYNIYAVNINGDGRSELVATAANNTYILKLDANNNYNTIPYNVTVVNNIPNNHIGYYPSSPNGFNYMPCSATIYPGDFNGDGKTDLLVYNNFGTAPSFNGGGGWEIGYSNGNNGFDFYPISFLSDQGPAFGYQFSTNYKSSNHQYFVADFNGDGKDDIVDEYFTPAGSVNFEGYSYIDYTNVSINAFFSNGNITSVTNGSGGSNSFASTYATFPLYYYSTWSAGPVNPTAIGDFNGDGRADLYYYGQGFNDDFVFSFDLNSQVGNGANKILAIANGYNKTVNINYDGLPAMGTNDGGYTEGNSATFPVEDIQWPLYVTAFTTEDNGTGTQNKKVYNYSGAQFHELGRGFLGFLGTTTIDEATNRMSQNTYQFNNGFFDGLLSENVSSAYSSPIVEDKTYTYTTQAQTTGNVLYGTKVHYNYVSNLSDNNDLYGYVNNYSWVQDIYGNITTTSFNNNVESGTTGYFYTTEPNTGWGGFLPVVLTGTASTNNRIGSSVYARFKNITPDAYGRPSLTSEDLGLVTQYVYDPVFGTTTSVTTSGFIGPTSTTTYTYDPFNRFVIQKQNALNQSTYTTYDDAYGNVLTSTDLNGLVTTNYYDGFGRIAKTVTPTGEITQILRGWDLISGIPNSFYFVQASPANAPSVTSYCDILDRTLRTQTTGFNGTNINVDEVYDGIGLLISKSEPYYTGNPSVSSSYTYEGFQRPSSINDAAGGTTTYTYTYGANTIQSVYSASPAPNKTVTKVFDAQGLLVSLTDNAGTITYTYASCDKPSQILSPGGAQTLITYDSYGRKVGISDADAGTTIYNYDEYGEKTYEQNPNQAKVSSFSTYTYDLIGRMITENEYVTGENTTYIWDNQPNGVGKVGAVTYQTGIQGKQCIPISSIGGYTYTYTPLGQLASKTLNLTINSYTTTYNTYNALNQVTSMTYPSGFQVNQAYTNGYLSTITSPQLVTGNNINGVIWQCNTMSEHGKVTSAFEGNGGSVSKTYDNLGFLQSIIANEKNGNASPVQVLNYQYGFDDAGGNLNNRSSIITLGFHNSIVVTENFTNDVMDRLTQVDDGATPILNMTYDASGNITSKSDIGSSYLYGSGAHAVTVIDNVTGLAPTQQQNVDYTSFSKAADIKQGNYELDYIYGANHQRVVSNLLDVSSGCPGTLQESIVYDGEYEEKSKGGITYKIHYINSPDGLVAIDVRQSNLSYADNINYVHTDHLGSINSIYDVSGNFVYSQSFDAWGNYHDPVTLAYNSPVSLTPPAWLIRGFTGHEHLPLFGLINMNGRIYDPLIGRVLSSDNYVQSAYNSQHYNRYAYCHNNPLKYKDPSGEFTFWDDALAFGIGFVVGYVEYGLTTGNWGWKALGAGAITGVEVLAAVNFLPGGAFGAAAGTTTFASVATPAFISFGISSASSTLSNASALNSANKSGWNGVWLEGAYNGVDAASAAISSTGQAGENGINNNKIFGAALSSGGNEFISKAYNPNTNSWSVNASTFEDAFGYAVLGGIYNAAGQEIYNSINGTTVQKINNGVNRTASNFVNNLLGPTETPVDDFSDYASNIPGLENEGSNYIAPLDFNKFNLNVNWVNIGVTGGASTLGGFLSGLLIH
jgi:RHS repeat-associated protein